MTPEQIAALTPDGLRMEIARRLGWHDFHGHTSTLKGMHKDHAYACYIPEFCTNMSAAWPLLEDMRLGGARITLHVQDKKHWQLAINDGTEYPEGRTLEIKICRAWLMWKDAQA